MYTSEIITFARHCLIQQYKVLNVLILNPRYVLEAECYFNEG